ncbi:hypothetical protein BGZ76_003489, partial [Entomortierella beljakovae]
ELLQMNPGMDVQISKEMIDWVKERIEDCRMATMPEFAKVFEYFNKEDADQAFSALINKSFLTNFTRNNLQNNYELWKRNEGNQFWASRIAKTEVATDLVIYSIPVAKKIVANDKKIVSNNRADTTPEIVEGG